MTRNLEIPAELEASVLGSLLERPELLEQLDWLEVTHFGHPHARLVFQAIRNLEAASKPVDVVTVGSALQASGYLNSEINQKYLSDCCYAAANASNVVTYAELVRDAALNRSVRLALSAVLESDVIEGQELLGTALAALTALDTGDGGAPDDVYALVRRRFAQLEEIARLRATGERTMTGYPTGVRALDEHIGGWQPKIVTIVCARPGMGKSSLGLATADATSAAGFGVHLFSLEDSEEAYADRAMSRVSRVAAEEMRNAHLSSADCSSISRATSQLRDRRWIIDGRSGVTADEIVRSVRKYRKANNTRVVIVDYIQLVAKARGSMARSTHEVLTEVVTTLANAAKQDGLAYVVMSQLNRDLEKRQDKRPMMSDLRESGSLEERAKCVVAMYRGAYYSQDPVVGVDYEKGDPAPCRADFAKSVQLLILKHNNGATGSVSAQFHGPTTTVW